MPESATAVGLLPELWLLDKPAGPTSHDIVGRVRRVLGRRVKVGHAGTLDPFATGLLVVLSGRATRLAAVMSGLDKRYRATIRTGWVSATGDPEGPLERSGEPASGSAIAQALAAFRGPQRQRVPAYSAVKVDGERLYRKARRGEAVEAPERPIEIMSLELVEDLGDGRAVLDVHCSKGTYIRQLVADIGTALGCGAYCDALRRTHVGDLSIDEAIAVDDVRPGAGLEPALGLAHLPSADVDAQDALAMAHGRTVSGDGSGQIAVRYAGRLVAVAEGDGAGTLRPRVVILGPEDLA